MAKDFLVKRKVFCIFAVIWAGMEIHSTGVFSKMVIFVYAGKKKSLYRLLILFSCRKDLFLRRILPVSCSI